jgi:hypothetical protein
MPVTFLIPMRVMQLVDHRQAGNACVIGHEDGKGVGLNLRELGHEGADLPIQVAVADFRNPLTL